MSHLCDYARDGVGSALMMALRVPGSWKGLEALGVVFFSSKKGESLRVLPGCCCLFCCKIQVFMCRSLTNVPTEACFESIYLVLLNG